MPKYSAHWILLYFHWRHRSKNQSSTTSLRLKAKNYTTYLHCCTSFHCCITRFSPSALHFVAPLPHSHHASNSNTHTKQKKTPQRFYCRQTPPHLHSVILLVSTLLRANTHNCQQKKKHAALKTPKPLSIHTHNPKVRHLLHQDSEWLSAVQRIEDYMCRHEVSLCYLCVWGLISAVHTWSRVFLSVCVLLVDLNFIRVMQFCWRGEGEGNGPETRSSW
jgi:hypothetical protein